MDEKNKHSLKQAQPMLSVAHYLPWDGPVFKVDTAAEPTKSREWLPQFSSSPVTEQILLHSFPTEGMRDNSVSFRLNIRSKIYNPMISRRELKVGSYWVHLREEADDGLLLWNSDFIFIVFVSQ